MNYYQFHIGDYAAHTRNLSLLEDLAYRRILDAYYLAERPLNGCATDVAREIGMRENLVEVEYVLEKFFVFESNQWVNERADIEIAKFQAKSKQASSAGKKSAERRLNVRLTSVTKKATPVENFPTDVQLTKNQEPITNNQIKDITPLTPQGGRDDDKSAFAKFWAAYPKKVGKDAAQKSFQKIKAPWAILPQIIEALDWQKKSEQWTRDGGQFIPNPATYLNQGRWKDEAAPQAIYSVRSIPNRQEALEMRNRAIVDEMMGAA